MNYLSYFPFTYQWMLRNAIGNNIKTVIDLGCGDGSLMKNISKDKKWDITGIELYPSSIKKASQFGIYRLVAKADVVNLPKKITKKNYDVVFASQVLEHLKKNDGKKAIKVWLRMVTKRLVITTPVGFIEYEPIEEKDENNPLQKHLSGWSPEEFVNLGFKVRGQGIRLIYGEKGFARLFPSLFPVWSLIALLFSPLVYFFPKLGLYMIAVKEV